MQLLQQNKIFNEQQEQLPSMKVIDAVNFYRTTSARHLNLNQLLRETFTGEEKKSITVKPK